MEDTRFEEIMKHGSNGLLAIVFLPMLIVVVPVLIVLAPLGWAMEKMETYFGW